MAQAATRTRHNRTITVNFHDKATYVQLLSDGTTWVACVLVVIAKACSLARAAVPLLA